MGKRIYAGWRTNVGNWLKRYYGIVDEKAIEMILNRVPKEFTNETKGMQWLREYMPNLLSHMYAGTGTGNASDDAILQRFKRCTYNPFVAPKNDYDKGFGD